MHHSLKSALLCGLWPQRGASRSVLWVDGILSNSIPVVAVARGWPKLLPIGGSVGLVVLEMKSIPTNSLSRLKALAIVTVENQAIQSDQDSVLRHSGFDGYACRWRPSQRSICHSLPYPKPILPICVCVRVVVDFRVNQFKVYQIWRKNERNVLSTAWQYWASSVCPFIRILGHFKSKKASQRAMASNKPRSS